VIQVRAPGRVCLVGEHTDYNAGLVLPAAIDLGYTVTVKARLDGRTVVTSVAYSDEWSLGDPREDGWRRYAAGVLHHLSAAGVAVDGLDVEVSGDLLPGRGLGSSGAFEFGIALAVATFRGRSFPRIELARLCLAAETEYVGVKSELMDQFICGHGRRDHAVCLDMASMRWDAITVPSSWAFLLFDSGAPRALSGSPFNLRRQQCQDALAGLRAARPDLASLSDPGIREADLAFLEGDLLKRARHVWSENRRVQSAVRALRSEDLRAFTGAMTASHESLRADFETTTPELDSLCEAAHEAAGLHGIPVGAKVCGAGFGGCVLVCVPSRFAQDVQTGIACRFERDHGSRPWTRLVRFVDAASVQESNP